MSKTFSLNSSTASNYLFAEPTSILMTILCCIVYSCFVA